MSTAKKILNVVGIVFAWIISIALVVTLFVAPAALSALSTVKPAKIIDTLGDMEITQFVEAFGVLEGENEELMTFITTDTVQDLYEIYIGDLIDVFNNEPAQNSLTEDKIKEIVHNNVDELYQIMLQQEPEAALLPEAEAKQKAEELFSQALVELFAGLPTAQQLRQSVMEENPELQTAMEILAATDMIKLSYIAEIVVLSVLIFICRIPGFRGIRWLSVDLFVATGLSAFICVGFSMLPALLASVTEGQPALALVAQEFATAFTTGVYIRTGIMLISAIALLVAYIFVKKALVKKAIDAATEPVAEIAQPTE
jgi:hypothetical protein